MCARTETRSAAQVLAEDRNRGIALSTMGDSEKGPLPPNLEGLVRDIRSRIGSATSPAG